MLLHIRQNRRQARIFVKPRIEKHWAYSDAFGQFPKDEWEVTVYDGQENFAPIYQQMHANGNEFQVRPVGSPKDSWETVYIKWDSFGWYLTPYPWN